MDYTDLGFDQFLNLKQDNSLTQYSDADFEMLVDSISANKISEGVTQSPNLKVDFNQGQIERKEGATTRLKLGKFDDGKYGMRVYGAGGDLAIDQSA